MSQHIPYKSFDASKASVVYSGTSRKHALLYDGGTNALLQLPKGTAPFGVSKWDGMYGPQYTINVDVADAEFIAQWRALEASIADRFQNYAMISCLKNNDKSMRLDLDMHEDSFTGLIVDADSNPCDISLLKQGDQVICLAQLAHVWTSQKGKLGLKLQVVQMKVFPKTRLQDKATFLMDDDAPPATTAVGAN